MENIDIKELGCIKAATRILGDKWTPKLLRDLANNGAMRFSTLQNNVEGINPRTLSARLSYLEQEQIVSRTTYAEVPPRVEYALTQKGLDLWPILSQMSDWGARYYD